MIALAIVIAGLLLLGLLAAGLRRVPEGTVCTVHRFGHFVRALGPGLHMTWPLIEQIAHRIDLVGHQVELQAQSEGRCAAVVYFQILDPERAGAIIEQIDATVEQAARGRLAQLAAQPGEPEPLASRLKQDLNGQLGTLGLRVTRCQLRTA